MAGKGGVENEGAAEDRGVVADGVGAEDEAGVEYAVDKDDLRAEEEGNCADDDARAGDDDGVEERDVAVGGKEIMADTNGKPPIPSAGLEERGAATNFFGGKAGVKTAP